MTAGEDPRSSGYRMPAEWEPHAATWLAWPHNAEDWPHKFQPVPWVYGEIVRHLSRVEAVHIVVNDGIAEKRARTLLTRAGAKLTRVQFHRWATNRVWTRDSGPIFVKKGAAGLSPRTHSGNMSGDGSRLAVTDWKFNAWAKYSDWELDDQLPSRVAKLLGLPSWMPRFASDGADREADREADVEAGDAGHRVVLEGGSIDVNGAGALITTEECLLSPMQQRNPGHDRRDLERVFHDYLGADQVLWMNRGIAGDDTHGHVDDVTRFVAPTTLVTATEPNTADENHLPLAENLERLRAARDLAGKPFRIVELPMPDPMVFEGQRLPASYANFYIANGLVLVPTFNDANDRKALNTLADLFPDRRVIGIHCGDLIWGLGTLHCLTQQQPGN